MLVIRTACNSKFFTEQTHMYCFGFYDSPVKSTFFQQNFYFYYFPNNILINCLNILFFKYIYLVL